MRIVEQTLIVRYYHHFLGNATAKTTITQIIFISSHRMQKLLLANIHV